MLLYLLHFLGQAFQLFRQPTDVRIGSFQCRFRFAQFIVLRSHGCLMFQESLVLQKKSDVDCARSPLLKFHLRFPYVTAESSDPVRAVRYGAIPFLELTVLVLLSVDSLCTKTKQRSLEAKLEENQ